LLLSTDDSYALIKGKRGSETRLLEFVIKCNFLNSFKSAVFLRVTKMLDTWTISHLSRTTKTSFKNRIIVSKNIYIYIYCLQNGLKTMLLFDQIKCQQDKACVTHGRTLVGEMEGQIPLGRPIHRNRTKLKCSSATSNQLKQTQLG